MFFVTLSYKNYSGVTEVTCLLRCKVLNICIVIRVTYVTGKIRIAVFPVLSFKKSKTH